MGNAVQTLIAVAGDVASAFGFPGGGSAAEAYRGLTERRLRRAQDILVGELKGGKKTLYDVDPEEASAILFRYLRAANEGAARLNLRLLAKMIRGQLASHPLYASEFLRWADDLASLRREEVIVLAAIHRHSASIDLEKYDNTAKAKSTATQHAKAELIPSVLSDDEFHASCVGASRTGLLLPPSAWDNTLYWPGPGLSQVAELALFEEALKQEPNDHGS